MKAAVVGHVEWIEFARVERVPTPGEIVHAHEWWEEAAGGGAVAAVQLAKLADTALIYTALGDDPLGHATKQQLERHGVHAHVAFRDLPQRRGFVFLDSDGERTITTIHERYGPSGTDQLAWDELADADAVYFVSGDAAALQQARRARVLVATARSLDTLVEGGVELDVLVHSSKDAGERYTPGQLEPPPRFEVATAGSEGGTWTGADGNTGSFAAAPLPGPKGDSYGAGDSFAAALTFGLGKGLPIDDALALASRCGAAKITGRAPYDGQLRASDI
jgi:ribokinase